MTRLLLKGCLLFLLLIIPVRVLAENFSGYAETKGFAFAERPSSNDPWLLGWGTLFNKWEQKVGESQLTASLRGEWLSSDEQGSRLFDLADRQVRRPPFSVQDLWVRLPLSTDLDLQMGRFKLGWGKTDGYSPADAFLPRDLTDPFADEKIPLWAVRLTGQDGTVRYEAVACPVTTPWRLPLLGSRNAPLSAERLPEGTAFQEGDTSPPWLGFVALRILATFGEWDLGGWGRVGVSPAPLLEFRFDRATATSSGLVIPVERRYAREEGVGVELSRIIGSWVVRGEAAALFSRDSDLGDALIGAVSTEKGFGDGTLLITLAGNAIDPPVDESFLFDRAILPALIIAWNRTEEWGEWKLVWSAGLKQGDGLLKTEVGYNVTDLWKLTLGAELPYGSNSGPFGSLHAAQRIHVALQRSW